MTNSTITNLSDDDDVKFVISVPRRRKRKRRRLECSRINLEAYQPFATVPTCSRPLRDSGHNTSTRRVSTGMVQRLESRHITNEDQKPTLMRGNSLPENHCCLQSAPRQSSISLTGALSPQYAPTQELKLQPIPASMHCNDQPSPTQSAPFSPFAQTSSNDKDLSLRNQRASIDQDDMRLQKSFIEVQTSPRTKTMAPMNFQTSVGESNNSKLDVSSWPDVHDLSKLPTPDLHLNMPFWSATWMAPRSADRQQNNTQQIIPLSLSKQSDALYITKQNDERSLSCVTNHAQSSNQDERQLHLYEPFETDTSTDHRLQEQRLDNNLTQWSAIDQKNTLDGHRPSSRVNLKVSSTPFVPANGQMRPRSQKAQVSHNIASQSRGRPCLYDTTNHDIIRKPSLYKIPVWSPSSPPLMSAQQSTPSFDQRGKEPGLYHPTYSPSGINRERMATPSSMAPIQHGTTHRFTSKPTRISPSTLSHQRPPSTFESQSRQTARQTTRKFSPNLIVDIAETCQELFPFATVANRHAVPIQKVFDTFSAIIQLPLLRNADDRRRHGSLGKKRQNEFRDAKRAMAKAQKARGPN